MPQYAPQLGTRVELTGQFVANGREPWTPGAVRAEPPDADDGERVARDDAEAVTPDAGLRSRCDVVAGAPCDAERLRGTFGADVAGAVERTTEAPAAAEAAG